MPITRRDFFMFTAVGAAWPVLTVQARAGQANEPEWLRQAQAGKLRGQSVAFNAWAGSEPINAYIAWVAEQVQQLFGISLTHVKVNDAAEVVRRVRDEVKAGVSQGSADLVWINGENFQAMKTEGLLFGPFAFDLPNFALVDTRGKPTTMIDFAQPTEGFESPWGMAQLTFFGNAANLAAPPQTMQALLEFAKAHEGRITYPAPPEFHGTTFIKQALYETLTDAEILARPVTAAAFDKVAAPLFAYLDALHPHLWRQGKQFPPTQAQVTQMLGDGELVMGLSFNPNEAANLVQDKRLPVSTVAWQFAKGTIGNTHFVAIPGNSKAKEAAQVVANFLLSPQAQGRKADLAVWGDPTVLDMAKLSTEEAKYFTGSPMAGQVATPAPALPEPHGSWVPLIEAAWLSRYGA